ncbi:hypothetical protein Tco_0223571 [Tanacetum coccineum]
MVPRTVLTSKDLKDKRVIDNGCSRHMTGNRSYLTDYKEIDGGFVAFGGYSTNSKAFRVFNSGTRIVEENLHVQFSENIPNIAGSGPNWLFVIDCTTKSLTISQLLQVNQLMVMLGTKACDNAGKARVETGRRKRRIQNNKKKGGNPSEEGERVDQEKDANVNNTNNINTVSSTVNAAGIEDNVVDENIVSGCADDPNMPALEEIVYSDNDEDIGAEADMNNWDAFVPVSPIPTTRVHKDHPLTQVIGDLQSSTLTRSMSQDLEEHGLFSSAQQRTNHKDLQNCLFACFLSQEEPKKIVQALKDPRWIEAMQEELLQFKLQEV